MMRMSMKMAAVSTISLLLLCCFAISPADSQDRCNYNAMKGEDFTVPLSLKLEPSHRLKWIHNNEIILDRLNGKYFKGKKEDVSENGSLILKNLKDSNNGKYTPQVFTTDGFATTNLQSINLCIFDRVPKPEVKKICSLPFVTFTCEVPAKLPKDLNFVWLQNGKELKEKTKTLKRNAKEVEKDSFQCKVSNPVSSETSGPVTQECYISESPKPIFPEKLLGINTWIFVGAGGGVVLVLMIVVIVCCVRTKRKKRMQLKGKDEGELRLAWTNEQQHQHHQQQHQHNHPPDPHHHRCQQQPAGHTGPRQHRSKQHREQQQHLRSLDPPSTHPHPSPRRPAQAPRPIDKTDDEQPPPLPQPRKKGAKIPRV